MNETSLTKSETFPNVYCQIENVCKRQIRCLLSVLITFISWTELLLIHTILTKIILNCKLDDYRNPDVFKMRNSYLRCEMTRVVNIIGKFTQLGKVVSDSNLYTSALKSNDDGIRHLCKLETINNVQKFIFSAPTEVYLSLYYYLAYKTTLNTKECKQIIRQLSISRRHCY